MKWMGLKWSLWWERMHATENLVIIHNCWFIGLKVIIYHELFPIFNVLFRIFTIFLCVTHILRCAYLSLMSLNLFLPSWNTFTCFHNFFLFSPLSFSPFFLQEPQTTVIHNPVDGIKVHPPPFCPHLFFLYWFSFVIVVPTLFL